MKNDVLVCYAKYSEDGGKKAYLRKILLIFVSSIQEHWKKKSHKTKHLSAKLTRFELDFKTVKVIKLSLKLAMMGWRRQAQMSTLMRTRLALVHSPILGRCLACEHVLSSELSPMGSVESLLDISSENKYKYIYM